MADTFKGNRTRPWGRWVLAALALLLLLLVPVYFAWTASLQRRFDARVAALRAAGEPVALEDFNTPPIPDDQNAVVDLRRAWTAVAGSASWQSINGKQYKLPLSTVDSAAIRAAVAENRPAFDDLDKAAAKPGAHWQVVLKSPAISTLLPELNDQNNLARFLHAAALDAHVRGDDAGAVRIIRRMLVHARIVARHPMAIGHLVAAGVGTTAAGAANEIAPDLTIDEAAGVPPEQVRALIDDLLDVAALRESFRAGLLGERMAQVDSVRGVIDGSIPFSTVWQSRGARNPLIPLTAKPLVLRDGLILLDHSGAAIAAAGAENLPAFSAACLPMPAWMHGSGIGHAVGRVMMPAYPSQGQSYYHAIAERRLTATVLALRWYAQEHDGRRPGKLSDLVPRYLPAVPIDPFAPGRQPIRYVSGGADGAPARVYSLGVDGRDGGGASNANRWQGIDVVIPLERPDPVPDPMGDPAVGY